MPFWTEPATTESIFRQSHVLRRWQSYSFQLASLNDMRVFPVRYLEQSSKLVTSHSRREESGWESDGNLACETSKRQRSTVNKNNNKSLTFLYVSYDISIKGVCIQGGKVLI
uniref:(northern house mosquito) hypothetical protein n=1 Tax=Culex pipiens TaxID=7175 RepID=A0A8D8IQP2_CULPI